MTNPAADASYKRYLLFLLVVILAFNYMDRMALGVLLQDIKAELQLTDTQLGFLSGIAFALFYAAMGIPIARWADRGDRVKIISVTTALWSAAVALCGKATGFVELLLIRVWVGVGEAGCIPPAHSLIADYFSRAERPRAAARYMLGVPLAVTLGYFAAGWLNQLYGWRATFVILGFPGLVLAVLAWLTLKEPRREQHLHSSMRSSEPGFREICATLWANGSFRHLLICFSVWYFFGYGLLQWTPAFFIRSHGLATGELGNWLSLIYGLGGGLGIYLGGEWAARYAGGNERLQLTACALAFCFFAVLNVGAFLASDYRFAFAALALAAVGGNVVQGPILGSMQTLVPPRMRAMSIALVYLFANLVGMGFGPLAAGALSDALQPQFGQDSLRYALAILSPGYLWAAWHLWRAGMTIARDFSAAQELSSP
jgi:MFS family permease